MRMGKGAAVAAALMLFLLLATGAAFGVWWMSPGRTASAEVQVARADVGGPVSDGDDASGVLSTAPDVPIAEPFEADDEPAAPAGGEAVGKPGSETAQAEVGDDPHAGLAQKNGKNGKDDKAKEQEIQADYTPLLKDPGMLEFHPDENLFRNVYYSIRQSFVEPVTDEQLFSGMVKEVRLLLKQAKVSDADLAKLDKNKNVLRQLVQLYGNRVNKDVLVYVAIQGMLQGLKDPYSLLMSPKEYRQLQEQVQNKGFGGIGIYIELDKDAGNQLTVFEPIDGTPAAKAGLESGDKIVSIDGKTTKGITLDKAQAAIRGPVGSKVLLTVTRKGEPKPISVSITRGEIHVVSVTSKMLPDRIGYVRLRLFGTLTADELEKELDKLKAQGARALVLDLRNNGGGYIDAAVNVVGQFTSPGALVVYTLNRQKDRRDYTSSTSGGLDVPMVVMINKFSASASEITAGALRDHKLAKLVGEHSFGKGSVQQLYPFNDDSALKLTIARFYSPAGHVIDHKGIEPDYSVEMEPRYVGKLDKDTQLKKALQVLKGTLAAK